MRKKKKTKAPARCNADKKVTQLTKDIAKFRDIERQKLKRIRALERSIKADKCE